LSPRKAILFTFLIVILLPYYYFVDRPRPKVAEIKEQQVSLLNIEKVNELTVSNGAETIRYQLTPDGRYQVVEPQGKFVPQDLIEAVIALLRDAKSVEIVSTDPGDMEEFGLDHPKGELVIQDPSKPKPIDIQFGNENPTSTAIYARINGEPKVFLLGKNLEYYQRLMFEWVEGKQGKNA
jgi:Domain of unknown function (DUF4340)